MNFGEFTGKRICVALSGGADSLALLHYLKERAEAFSFLLSAVNCEHGLRGEKSLADTRFVQALCKDWGVPLFCFSEDCAARANRDKVSVETAAREFRYECFESLLAQDQCDYIALGHHADDEAETLLFRLCRGASLTGAGAMKEVAGRYLRPLLSFSKEEILSYAKEKGLSYRTDESNFEPIAARNRLRLEVLPKLEEIIPGATENLSRFAFLAAADDEYLYALSKSLIEKAEKISAEDSGLRLQFCKEKPLFFRACLTVLKTLGLNKDYTQKHLESVYALQEMQTGARAVLKGGIVAERIYDKIAFFIEGAIRGEWSRGFAVGSFDGGSYEITVSTEPIEGAEKLLRFDGEKVPENAVFRFPEEGDTFEKFGGGRKSLKKYLVDKKISARERESLPVLADGKEILLVCGVEISEKLRVDERTQRTLYVSIKRKEP